MTAFLNKYDTIAPGKETIIIVEEIELYFIGLSSIIRSEVSNNCDIIRGNNLELLDIDYHKINLKAVVINITRINNFREIRRIIKAIKQKVFGVPVIIYSYEFRTNIMNNEYATGADGIFAAADSRIHIASLMKMAMNENASNKYAETQFPLNTN